MELWRWACEISISYTCKSRTKMCPAALNTQKKENRIRNDGLYIVNRAFETHEKMLIFHVVFSHVIQKSVDASGLHEELEPSNVTKI